MQDTSESGPVKSDDVLPLLREVLARLDEFEERESRQFWRMFRSLHQLRQDPPAPRPDADVARVELDDLLETMLPPKLRAAVALRLLGYSFAEISEELNVSRNTIRAALHGVLEAAQATKSGHSSRL